MTALDSYPYCFSLYRDLSNNDIEVISAATFTGINNAIMYVHQLSHQGISFDSLVPRPLSAHAVHGESGNETNLLMAIQSRSFLQKPRR